MFAPIVPLIISGLIYLLYKDRSRYIREQALEAINFQLCALGAFVVATVLSWVFLPNGIVALVWLLAAVFGLIGAASAYRGDPFRYPLSHRFLK